MIEWQRPRSYITVWCLSSALGISLFPPLSSLGLVLPSLFYAYQYSQSHSSSRCVSSGKSSMVRPGADSEKKGMYYLMDFVSDLFKFEDDKRYSFDFVVGHKMKRGQVSTTLHSSFNNINSSQCLPSDGVIHGTPQSMIQS